MIDVLDIQPGDLIRVVVVVDDVEDEQYAKVFSNREDHLEIHYFEETSWTYKGARVYALEETMELIRPESLCEHYPDGQTIFAHVKDTRYVIETEIDSGEESTFYDESDDSGSDLKDFVVSDDDQSDLPPDHETLDTEWRRWVPPSEGSRGFKRVVDDIEARARLQRDDALF